jgi:hypothetical protein
MVTTHFKFDNDPLIIKILTLGKEIERKWVSQNK